MQSSVGSRNESWEGIANRPLTDVFFSFFLLFFLLPRNVGLQDSIHGLYSMLVLTNGPTLIHTQVLYVLSVYIHVYVKVCVCVCMSHGFSAFNNMYIIRPHFTCPLRRFHLIGSYARQTSGTMTPVFTTYCSYFTSYFMGKNC